MLGSSPSAGYMYDEAKVYSDVVATCNNGITLEPVPTWYWLSDTIAVKKHWRQFEYAKRRGTKLVTYQHALSFSPLLKCADLLIEASPSHVREWVPGQYVNGRTSGCFLAQFAVNSGAERVLLVGMEGYTSGPGQIHLDYFDGRRGLEMHKLAMESYGGVMSTMITHCQDVQFEFFGKPVYHSSIQDLCNVVIHE